MNLPGSSLRAPTLDEELLASATDLVQEENTLHVTDILPVSVTHQAILALKREDDDDSSRSLLRCRDFLLLPFSSSLSDL